MPVGRAKSCSAFFGSALFGVLVAMGPPSQAQDIPNLVGTWKGVAQAVYVGDNPYRPAERQGPKMGSDTLEHSLVANGSWHSTPSSAATATPCGSTAHDVMRLEDPQHIGQLSAASFATSSPGLQGSLRGRTRESASATGRARRAMRRRHRRPRRGTSPPDRSRSA